MAKRRYFMSSKFQSCKTVAEDIKHQVTSLLMFKIHQSRVNSARSYSLHVALTYSEGLVFEYVTRSLLS